MNSLTERSSGALAESKEDILLACLVWLAHFHERPMSGEALRAGLPLVDNQLTPELFVRACSRAGLTARTVKRPLREYSKHVLPGVLLLKDRKAVILTRLIDEQTAEVLLPDTGFGLSHIPIAELEATYLGFGILARPVYRAPDRSLESEEIADSGKHWFARTLLQYWPTWSQVAVGAVLINVFALVTPLFAMNIYDRVVPNLVMETLWVLTIGTVLVLGFEFAIRLLRGYFIDFAGKNADILLASKIFQHILGMQLSHRPGSAGAFANELREFETLRDFFTSATLATLIDLPFVFLFIGMIAVIGGSLGWVPLAALPIVIAVGLLLQIPLDKVVRRSFRESALRHAILIETLNGLETIKSVGAEGRVQRHWEQFIAMASKSGLAARLYSSVAVNFSVLAQGVVYAAVIVFGVYEIAAGNMTTGALVACSILSGRAMAPLAQVAGLLTRYNQSMQALKALDRVMQAPLERPAGHALLHRPHIAGAIEFRDVTFEYPQGGGKALDGVSFKIRPGEKVALVGRVGSGKSTASKLILGLFRPTSGAVLIDGTDSRQIDPADLRRAIGVVPQDIFLMNGTIKDNIVLGAPEATDAHVLFASRLVGLDEFVRTMPDGYDLVVGERGERLSGGQRQAVALARAFVREPSIALLDEPTSAMDQGTEELIKHRLAHALQGKSLILITHRPSLLSLVDRLIVLDRGKIIADGPRDSVMKAMIQGQLRAVPNTQAASGAAR
ncbi:MAG TPA: type I secretion system permease/ATPase [Alphaproteobacteria bacterium]|nr:type I secretion system permease/ATPase [Alphaproteobacteria bacterium]